MSKKNPTTEALEELSNTYGTSPDQLYDALHKQAELNAALTLGQLGFFVGLHVLCIVGFFMWRKSVDKRYNTDTEDFLLPIAFGGLVIFTIGMIVAIPVSMTDVFTSTYNPEYWIYQQIQNQLESINS